MGLSADIALPVNQPEKSNMFFGLVIKHAQHCVRTLCINKDSQQRNVVKGLR